MHFKKRICNKWYLSILLISGNGLESLNSEITELLKSFMTYTNFSPSYGRKSWAPCILVQLSQVQFAEVTKMEQETGPWVHV